MTVVAHGSQWGETLESRQVMYSFLAEIFSREVDERLLERLRSLPFEAGASRAAELDDGSGASCGGAPEVELADLLAGMIDDLKGDAPDSDIIERLAVDYASIFLGANSAREGAFPYGSVYTSPEKLLNRRSTAEVAKEYAQYGLVQGMKHDVPADHLSLELSFMAMLCSLQREAEVLHDVEAAQRYERDQVEFFFARIDPWVFDFVEDGKRLASTPFYRNLFLLCEFHMGSERKTLLRCKGEHAAENANRAE